MHAVLNGQAIASADFCRPHLKDATDLYLNES
jgi:hypothetical protein